MTTLFYLRAFSLFAVAIAAIGSAITPRRALGADLPEQVFAVTPGDETQDVIFLEADRPVLLRLHIFSGDQGFRTAWEDRIERIRDFFDKNRDGKLAIGEFDANLCAQLLTSPFGQSTQLTGGIPQALQIDMNPQDGFLSFAELVDKFRPVYTPFLIEQNGSPNRREEEIFRRLDHNGDGKLSANEFDAAVASLFALDEDDDELLVASELDPNSNPLARRFFFRQPMQNNNNTFLIVDDRGMNDSTIAQLIVQYDKGGRLKNADAGDGKLARCEIGFDEATFLAADKNHDAKLEAGEIKTWLVGMRPEAEFRIDLPTGTGTTRIELLHGNGKPIERNASPYFPAGQGNLQSGTALYFVDSRVEVWPDPYVTGNLKQIYVSNIENADGDKNGVFERKEVEATFLGQYFDILDRDGDGKIVLKDFERLAEIQEESVGARCVLRIADKGRSLFDVFDKNHDQILSVREIREAKGAILAFDRDGDRSVSFEEITRRFRLKLGRGNAGFAQQDPEDNDGNINVSPFTSSPIVEGAPWFHRMDRNADGDVSRREFLGTDADFRLIDRDGDGLIDPKEAAAAPY